MSNTPKFGQFNGTVQDLVVNIGSKPAIFTRVNISQDPKVPEIVTHRINLDNPDSQRIGFDELRSAFPNELGQLDDRHLLTTVMTKTSQFTGKPAIVAVEPQTKNGVQVKGPAGQIYFNVRLRSGVRDLTEESATALADKLLGSLAQKSAVEDAFSSS